MFKVVAVGLSTILFWREEMWPEMAAALVKSSRCQTHTDCLTVCVYVWCVCVKDGLIKETDNLLIDYLHFPVNNKQKNLFTFSFSLNIATCYVIETNILISLVT